MSTQTTLSLPTFLISNSQAAARCNRANRIIVHGSGEALQDEVSTDMYQPEEVAALPQTADSTSYPAPKHETLAKWFCFTFSSFFSCGGRGHDLKNSQKQAHFPRTPGSGWDRRRASVFSGTIGIMGMLAVCVLVCAVMVQIKAAAVQDADLKKFEATNELVKRWRRCSNGWSRINTSCFRYIPASKTWAQAERSCRSMGATLASVHSIEEYHLIQRLIMAASHEYKEAWIGGSDAQEEGVWLWSDGSNFYYTNWCPGEPNNGRHNQNCVQMNFSSSKCWDDLQCFNRLPYICSKKM